MFVTKARVRFMAWLVRFMAWLRRGLWCAGLAQEFLKGAVRLRKTYRITKLPRYLIFHIKVASGSSFWRASHCLRRRGTHYVLWFVGSVRHLQRFTKNNFFLEKNPTIVNFPLNNLEMRPCKHTISAVPFAFQVAS